ncbi:RICIN domain-containing protein [Catellatospora sp. NPDC049609]|uniref:RICIN domain-containing protein n=1 Tax=Catellatospora sp. NPDC049609 TaxID=3155505 RepID=UPI003431A539
MNMRRRLTTLVLATAVAAITGLATAGSASAAPTAQDAQTLGVGVFQQIRNEYSNKCVIPKGNSLNPNAPIVQRTCDNSKSQHRWALFPTENGYYWIVNQGSGLCLDLAANSEDEVTYGTRAQQFYCNRAYTSEEWYPISYFGTGIWLFQNKVKNLCIDVLGRSSSNDAPLQVIECKLYETAQQFYYY